MAYAVNQDESSQTSWWATQWSSIISGSTWEESLSAWKLSNVMGGYISNYGALKTQLMIGFERKINMLYKYEWYLTQPTKVLVNGEGKIDMAKSQKTSPYWESLGLIFSSSFQSRSVTYFADDIKKADEKKWVAAAAQMTVGTQNVTVTTGNSTETIAVGNKTITATVGSVAVTSEVEAVRLNGGGSSIVLNMANVIVSGPVINLG